MAERGSEEQPKKATIVARRIVDAILDGELTSGDRLPAEGEMVELYAAGRSTVREALRLLESQGVVSIRPGVGGGPVVSERDARGMAANIALLLQLSGATFRAVIDARLVLEPQIAAEAARAADRSVVAELRASLDASRRYRYDHRRLVSESARFHDLVAASSSNPLFEHLLKALHFITEPFAQELDYAGTRPDRLLRAHERIVVALESRDADKAEHAMRKDLQDFVRHVKATRPTLFDEPIRWSQVQ